MSLSAEIRTLSNRTSIRCLALVVLFTASTRFEPLTSAVLDPDLWWHLRDGNGIVAQHMVPRSGVYTQFADHSWVDYSWGTEVVMSRFHGWFGLMGLLVLRALLETTITAVVFLMLRRGLGNFWQALFLTVIGMWAIHHCLGMQPMLFSIAMFSVELWLIFDSLRRNSARPLFWLPLLFLFWANIHIQFVYGLFVLGLLAFASLFPIVLPPARRQWLEATRGIPRLQVLGIAAASFLSTFLGPNSWHLYEVIFHYLHGSAYYDIIGELQALNFRVPENFVFALIVTGSFFALGWRRSREPFRLALLIVCTMVGFRMTRDSWFACLPALAIIADRQTVSSNAEATSWPRRIAFATVTAALTAVIFSLVIWDSKTNNASLARAVAGRFPVEACAFVRAQSLPGPIYNDMNWGGFLIWALPEKPVAIDNRPDLYGDDVFTRFYFVQQGWRDWKVDPNLNAAQVVLLSHRDLLANALPQDQHFRLVYQDPLALVFTRNDVPPTVSRNNKPALP